MFFKLLLVGLLLGLTGCSNIKPPTSIHQPMSAKPVAKQVVVPADGAIFHAGVDERRSLFEDKRARNVGDLLTINIVEKTTGNRKSSGGASMANSINANLPNGSSGPLARMFKAFPIVSSSSNKIATTGAGAASEDLSGTISVTVIEVLANGNLVVAGEEQVGLNQSDEFIRFSGVVNLSNITNENTVLSTQVADAHIEYRNAGAMNEVINDAKTLGFLGRFFQSVMPF
jgi:flagellar L-ring protein precursor FlgH